VTENERRAVDALGAVYDWVDGELHGVGTCRACGRCCHFKTYGHRLYACYAEALYLLAKHGLPPVNFEDDRCGYQQDAVCLAREGRVLGCRTFFCGRDTRKTRDVHSRALDAIRRITVELGLPWDYRPLVQHLEAPVAGASQPG